MSDGIVYLVGGGPGDVGLLTLRGAACLREADVVIYDHLANPELLRFCKADAEIIYAGKTAKTHRMEQDEINRLLVAKAKSGKCVVRFKGGDPFVFGRGAEEAEALADAGVRFEIVPGVTSAVAAPAYAGIPLTKRGITSSVVFLTGHEDPTKAELLDWEAFAKLDSTKVILMGVSNIEKIAALLGRHAPATTPVAVIHRGTTGSQQTVTGTLADIAGRAQHMQLKPPALIVVGEVVKLRERLNWFETKPLFGRRVVVTRSRDQAGELSGPLTALGAEVLEIPTIKITPPKSHADMRDALKGIGEYDWLVFASANAVEHFFRAFFAMYGDIRDLGGVKIGAIGPATAVRVAEFRLSVDLQPEESVAESVVKAFAEHESVENLRFLLPRGDLARDALPEGLRGLGAIVDAVECYRTVPETDDVTGNIARLKSSGADIVTFTSGSTVDNFCELVDLAALQKQFTGMKLASIGPTASQAISGRGLHVDAEANPHTIPGLLDAIVALVGKKPA